MNEYSHLTKAFWGRHLWARGCFCCSSGNVMDGVIAQYIENQRHEAATESRVEGKNGPKGRTKPSA
jgi:putative transposase